MNLKSLVLCLVLISVGGMLAVLRGCPNYETTESTPTQQQELAESVVPPTAPVSGVGREQVPAAEPTPVNEPPRDHAGQLTLNGTTQFLDIEGNPRPSSRGYIEWDIRDPGGLVSRKISPVSLDSWTLDVQRGSEVVPVKAMWSSEMTSQYARVTSGPVATDLPSGHVVTAQLSYGFALYVLDATTLQHLQEVEVVFAHATDEAYLDARYPPEAFLSEGASISGDSPLLLPHLPGSPAGWVRAPGYAWTRFAFTGDEGSLTIALAPGADLDVTVLNMPPGATHAAVVLYPEWDDAGQDLDLNIPIAHRRTGPQGTTSFSGLPCGSVSVVVVSSDGSAYPGPRLGQVRSQLTSGQPQHLVVDLAEASANGSLGSIHTVVSFDSSVQPSNMTRVCIERVGLRRQGGMEEYLMDRQAQADGCYHALRRHLPEGDYIVSLLPQGLQRQISVRGGGEERVEFTVIPPSAELKLAVVHQSGTRSIDADVRICPLRCNSTAAFLELKADPQERLYKYPCQPGEYTVVVLVSRHKPIRRTVTVSGSNDVLELKLEPERLITLRLQAVQSQNEVLLPEEFWRGIDLKSLDGSAGRVVWVTVNSSQVVGLQNLDAPSADYKIDQPGSYEVSFPRFPGLRQIPPLVVSVTDDGLRLEMPFEAWYE